MTAQNAPIQVADYVERLGRLVRARGYSGGLNPAQWEALRYLGRCNRFSSNPTALATFLDATKGTVSQTLSALERKGLVRKVPRPGHGRSLALVLTPKSRDVLDIDPLQALRSAAARLGEEADGLACRLRALLAEMRSLNGVPTFGTCRTCRHFVEDAPDGAPHRCGLFEAPLAADESGQICVGHSPADHPREACP